MTSDNNIDLSEMVNTVEETFEEQHIYANLENPPDLKFLFTNKSSTRQLLERSVKNEYNEDISGKYKDQKQVAALVVQNVFKVAKSLKENENKELHQVKISLEILKTAAKALSKLIPSTMPELWFDWTNGKGTNRGGLLYYKVRAMKDKDKCLTTGYKKRKSDQSTSSQPSKYVRAAFYKKKGKLTQTSPSTEDNEDIIVLSGLPIVRHNFQKFKQEYIKLLVDENKRLDLRYIKACSALFAFEGSLVSIEIYSKL